jgi:hypothetical protein
MNDVCVEGVRWQEILTSYLTLPAFLPLLSIPIKSTQPNLLQKVHLPYDPKVHHHIRFEPEEFSPHTSTPVKLTRHVELNPTQDGFGGLVVSMLASGTQGRGFKPLDFYECKNPQ